MAMRRALCAALRRHARSECIRISRASGAILQRPTFLGNSGLQHLCQSRDYSKKSAKANKKVAKGRRKQEEDEEDEDDEEEEDEDDDEEEEEAEAVPVDVSQPKRSAKQNMESAMEALSVEFGKLRTGRASAGMLDHVEVEVEGKNTGLKQIAAISVANPQTLTVTPFDTAMVKKVEAAIRLSPLNLNPVAAELTITVPIPKVTKEHGQTICKLASKAAEESKKSIRRGRQLGMDHLKKISSSLSKDELKRYEKEIDDVTKQFIKAVDDTLKKKEAEIMASA